MLLALAAMRVVPLDYFQGRYTACRTTTVRRAQGMSLPQEALCFDRSYPPDHPPMAPNHKFLADNVLLDLESELQSLLRHGASLPAGRLLLMHSPASW